MKAEMMKRGNFLFILAKHVDKKLLRRLLEDPLDSYNQCHERVSREGSNLKSVTTGHGNQLHMRATEWVCNTFTGL